MSAPDERPTPGDACLCCRNKGVLPPAELNGQPVNVPGLVDSETIQQCCDECIDAMFLGGGPSAHPHELDVPGILGGAR